MSRVEISNMKFGKLTALRETTTNKRYPTWLCQCECGNQKEIPYYNLLSKRRPTLSCGCLRIKKITTHGCWGKNERLYRIWCGMKQRCCNTKSTNYNNYGGRGIKVCEEWESDFGLFYNWAMQNGYNDELTIDRINVDGNYEPSNCKWVTRYQQSINRRDNIFVSFKGKKVFSREIDKEHGFRLGTIARRLREGWDVEEATSVTPSLRNRRKV